MAAIALSHTSEKPILRVGADGADRVVWDLATPDGKAVVITPEGWRVEVNPEGRPRLYTGIAQPLPTPERVSRQRRRWVLRRLRRLLGFKLRDDRAVLLLGFMAHCLMPRGPT
jgi:hypothetical protein